MGMKITAADAAAKWSRRAGQATEDYKKGVQSVEVSPTSLAAKALEKARANYNESIDSGRMARRLNSVTREAWIADTTSKGATRYAAGVQAAVGKYTDFANEFFPYVETVQRQIASMPNVTFEDSLARMAQNARLLHEFSRR